MILLITKNESVIVNLEFKNDNSVIIKTKYKIPISNLYYIKTKNDLWMIKGKFYNSSNAMKFYFQEVIIESIKFGQDGQFTYSNNL